MIHGYLASSVYFTKMLKELTKKYRVVLFDMGGFGLNSRPQDCYGIESVESAENWLIEWLGKVFDTLKIPDKVHVAGHSAGGYLASLYASSRPERVESLFLISPGGTEPYDEETYDPSKFRDPEDLTQRFVPKHKVDETIMYRQAKRNMLQEKTAGLPRFAIYYGLSKPRWSRICHK